MRLANTGVIRCTTLAHITTIQGLAKFIPQGDAWGTGSNQETMNSSLSRANMRACTASSFIGYN